MTENQKHLITLLFVKYGGFRNVVDMWLYDDDKFSTEEKDAVDAWLADEQAPKPLNVTVHTRENSKYLTVEIPLDPSDDG